MKDDKQWIGEDSWDDFCCCCWNQMSSQNMPWSRTFTWIVLSAWKFLHALSFLEYFWHPRIYSRALSSHATSELQSPSALCTHLHSVQFSRSVVSDSLRPHESQHARPPCPSPTPGVHSDSCPSSQWCHPAIPSSVIPFSSCPQSLPASESFPVSQLFTRGALIVLLLVLIECINLHQLLDIGQHAARGPRQRPCWSHREGNPGKAGADVGVCPWAEGTQPLRCHWPPWGQSVTQECRETVFLLPQKCTILRKAILDKI